MNDKNDKQDKKIIDLFWARDESAINETEAKYRGFAHSVLYNFLASREDREECINDALLALWRNIPPERPACFSSYFARILKNIAMARTRAENAWKRGRNVTVVGEEFLADVTDGRTLADDYESTVAARVINAFLEELPARKREIFVLRYWFNEEYSDISLRTGKSEGNIRLTLKRLRDKLREMLKKEGIIYE